MTASAKSFRPGEALLRELSLDAATRLDLMTQVARAVCDAHPALEVSKVVEALEATERSGSTCVGPGVAIPHAEIAGVGAPIALNVTLERPVAWSSPPGSDPEADADVRRCVVIVVPPGRHAAHLELAAAAARELSE